MKKALALLMMVGVVGITLGMVGLMRMGVADATQHSADRSFSAASVPAGGELVVTITTANTGSLGNVVETLPEGFTYVSSSLGSELTVDDTGQILKVFFFGSLPSFTYTVTVSDTPGPYSFFGTVADEDVKLETIGGATGVTVEADAEPTPEATPDPPTVTTTPEPTTTASAARSFSPDPVEPGGQLVVTITPADLGGFGSVVETLPTGFSYVSSDLGADNVVVAEQTITFTLLSGDAFTYTVTSSGSVGSHNFSGALTDSERMTADVGGDSSVSVERSGPPPAGPSATRSLSPMVDARRSSGGDHHR